MPSTTLLVVVGSWVLLLGLTLLSYFVVIPRLMAQDEDDRS